MPPPGHRRTPGNLSELVKNIQRESARGRELWIKLTDEEGGGLRDPAKHEPSFLQRFLDEAAKQGVSSRPQEVSAEMQELVEEVKELQRTSKEVKEAWAKYCDDRGGGFRDPSRHPQEFLEDFLEQVDAEAVPRDRVAQEAVGEDVQELARKVARLERSTEEGKQCWHWWCEVEGGFSRYPDRNSAPMLRRFLDMMGTDASLASFRRKYAPTQQMVDRVNALQRSGPEFTAKWEQHCNDLGSRTRDPRLHISSFIQQFLDTHDRRGTSERLPPRGAARASDFEHTGQGSSSSGSAHFHDLVERVKDSQKESFKVRKLWHWLCEAEGGDVRDPAKHDAKFLQRFLDMQDDAEDLACTRQPPEDLLQKVRDAKRESSEANKMWERYCEEHGGGTYDARMHTATFLWEFLDLIGKVDGERTSSAPPRDLVFEVKQIQKKAPGWNEKWERFCDEHGDGVRDPNRHSADFLLRFLDAATDEQHCAIAAASPQELQTHVKNSIDSDSDWKERWQRFCDDNGSPSYDPRKSDSILLRRFLDTMAGHANQTPEGSSGGKAGGREGRAEAGGAEFRDAEYEEDDADDGTGSQRELAERVKAAQKSSREMNKAWEDYCNSEGGGTCDPRRHPTPFLRKFLKDQARKGMLEDDGGAAETRAASRQPRGRQETSWNDLVDQVRAVQSRSKRINVKWNEYCDEFGGGTKDPMLHAKNFLRDFLASVEGLDAPSGPRPRTPPREVPPPRQREAAPSWQEPKPVKAKEWVEQVQRKSEDEKGSLTSDVQAAIAASREVQTAWNQFCDAKGCGVRDPNRHVASFLQRFLSSLEKDAPARPGSSAGTELVQRVRSAQSSSHAANDAWNRHCDAKGAGVRDPSRHPAAFLREFLSSLEGPKAREEAPVPVRREPPREIPPRREPPREVLPRREPPRGEAPARRGQKRPGDSAPDAEEGSRESLVAKVKAIQSSSKRVNERWTDFCNEHGGGTRDPSRHDADFLRDFLASLPAEWRREEPRPAWSADQAKDDVGAGGDHRPWERRVRPRRQEVEESAPPFEEDLVEQIKSLQRSSRQHTEAWREYCSKEGGGICDPRRHPASFLKSFLRQVRE